MRSVRRFAPEPVPEDVLADILRVARWTGSSKNDQPWEVVVVRDPATLEAMSKLGQYAGHLAGARVGIVLVMEPGYELDAGRLAQNVMLGAWAHGVGSCIATIFPEPNCARAKEVLGVPQERVLDTAISLGYPAAPAEPRPRGVPAARKPLEAMVNWEQYGRRSP
jgi:nitroreductase